MNIAEKIEDFDVATSRLHALTGELKGFWSITVRANCRVIFRFYESVVSDVDLVDYH